MGTHDRWVFSDFELEPASNTLLKRGRAVRIAQQPDRALVLLVKRDGQLVTREELRREIWGDRVHVEFEHGLNVCIGQIRSALGDDGDATKIVLTCPREGYRLGVPVKYVAAASGSSADAHAWYWRGRLFYDQEAAKRPGGPLRYFEMAAHLDPSFAPAHASLAISYLDRAEIGVDSVQSSTAARQAAQRAADIGPTLAETHVAIAEIKYRLDGDYAGAEHEFANAIAQNDVNPFVRQRYAVFLQQALRFDDALDQLRAARSIDSLSVMTSWQIANTLFLAGRYSDALEQAQRTLALDPTHPWSFRTVGQCLEALGNPQQAIINYVQAGNVAMGHLGRAYAVSGRRGEARQLLTELTNRTADTSVNNEVAIAHIHDGLGDRAEAIRRLRKARHDGVRLPLGLQTAPQWDSLRHEHDFKYLVTSGLRGI